MLQVTGQGTKEKQQSNRDLELTASYFPGCHKVDI